MAPPHDRSSRRWWRWLWHGTLPSIVALALARRAETAAAEDRRKCTDREKDCGYFGCYPPGSACPPRCDQHDSPESCHAITTATGSQACVFNPQYSGGKGRCQKNVQCFDLGGSKCSRSCKRCDEFGCLPNGTDCPASCGAFDDAIACETLGGVAGGVACQWDAEGAQCAPVPLRELRRTLFPPPLLPFPALTIRDGATITPPGYPGPTGTSSTPAVANTSANPVSENGFANGAASPSPTGGLLDWRGMEGRPERLTLFVGVGVAAVGLVCVASLLYYRRAKKRRMNEALAAGLPDRDDDVRRSALSSAMPENPPRTLFHRESLISHISRAVRRLNADQPPPSPRALQQQQQAKPDPEPLEAVESPAHSSPFVEPILFRPSALNLPRKLSGSLSTIDVDAESPLARIAESNLDPEAYISDTTTSAILTSPFKS